MYLTKCFNLCRTPSERTENNVNNRPDPDNEIQNEKAQEIAELQSKLAAANATNEQTQRYHQQEIAKLQSKLAAANATNEQTQRNHQQEIAKLQSKLAAANATKDQTFAATDEPNDDPTGIENNTEVPDNVEKAFEALYKYEKHTESLYYKAIEELEKAKDQSKNPLNKEFKSQVISIKNKAQEIISSLSNENDLRKHALISHFALIDQQLSYLLGDSISEIKKSTIAAVKDDNSGSHKLAEKLEQLNELENKLEFFKNATSLNSYGIYGLDEPFNNLFNELNDINLDSINNNQKQNALELIKFLENLSSFIEEVTNRMNEGVITDTTIYIDTARAVKSLIDKFSFNELLEKDVCFSSDLQKYNEKFKDLRQTQCVQDKFTANQLVMPPIE